MTELFGKILNEIFDVLGFSEPERQKAREDFRKKFYLDLLMALENRLPLEDKDWLKQNIKTNLPDYKKIAGIKGRLRDLYLDEEIQRKGREVFKKILDDYKNFMSSRVDSEKISKLTNVINAF